MLVELRRSISFECSQWAEQHKNIYVHVSFEHECEYGPTANEEVCTALTLSVRLVCTQCSLSTCILGSAAEKTVDGLDGRHVTNQLIRSLAVEDSFSTIGLKVNYSVITSSLCNRL